MRSRSNVVRGGMGMALVAAVAMAGAAFVSVAQASDANTAVESTIPGDGEGNLSLTAPTGVSITLDGKMQDWAAVPGISVPLEAIDAAFRSEPTNPEDKTVTLKVATDSSNVYVLMVVPDGYDYDPANHRLSPAIGVEWMIGEGASPHMGAAEPDFVAETGMVDIWHWELDCGPGELSGGTFPTGNDPTCNLDDEYATLLDEREDDAAENTLTGSWDHTARAQGIGASGSFIFEMKRPLQTGDPHDAQFTLGGSGYITLAYWDGNEGREKDGGWTDAGHVTSAEEGWITVSFASASGAPAPTAPSTGNAGLVGDSGTNPLVLIGFLALAVAAVVGGLLVTRRVRG